MTLLIGILIGGLITYSLLVVASDSDRRIEIMQNKEDTRIERLAYLTQNNK